MTGAKLLNAWIAEQQASTPPPMRWTVKGFARQVGVSRTNLNAWRRGAQTPTEEHAKTLQHLTNNAVPSTAWTKETP